MRLFKGWAVWMAGSVLLAGPPSAEDYKFAVGSSHVLVVAPDGVLYGVGDNRYGESGGDVPRTNFSRFTVVQGAPAVVDASIPVPFCSMALGADGKVYVWGKHDFGLLGGDGRTTTMPSRTPAAVPGLDRVRGLAGGEVRRRCRPGGRHRLDVGLGQGRGDGHGQADRTLRERTGVSSAKAGGGVTHGVQTAAGCNHVLALRKDGTVWSWGFNKFGQLGVGDTENRGIPSRVRGLTGVTRIYANDNMSAARLADGSWRLWGAAGPVGEGTGQNYRPALEPKPLPAHLRTTVDLGGAVFLLRDGSVWSCGDNSFGTLGTGGDTGEFSTSGVHLKQLTGVVGVWSDGMRTLALKNDGTLYLWGPRFVRANARVPMVLGKFPAILTAPPAP